MRNVTGTINVARSIFDHPMFDDGKPLSQREAWLWLISNAAWRPVQVIVRNGRSQELVNLERGQLTYSRSFLCKAWAWPSEKRVRTFLSRLEREHMIDLQTGQLQTVISICNYEVFQFGRTPTGPANGPAMGQQRAGNGPEEEDIINIKKNMLPPPAPRLPPPAPAGFEDFYSVYPRKKQRQAAIKAFASLMKSGAISLESLIAKTKQFAASWEARPKADHQYIPYPASWLNKGGYNDEPEAAAGTAAPAPIDWPRRLNFFHDEKKWLPTWGPEPGAPGCLVPPQILNPVSDFKGAA
jgi:hypothetical protein